MPTATLPRRAGGRAGDPTGDRRATGLPDCRVVSASAPTVVYTDGACGGNPGPGGWAWIVPEGGFASGAEARSTNQRMEIMAAWRALQHFRDDPRPIVIVADSTYVVKCFTDGWWKGWLARGWRNSQRQPVANRDLWEPFIELVNARGDVEFRWVKGHSGDRMNDMVDAMAVAHTLAR